MAKEKCDVHDNHDHVHGEHRGHTKIKHRDHTDYLHGGHMRHKHGDHYDEHHLEVNATNPDQCAPIKHADAYGPGCGHEALPHGDHTDLHRRRPTSPVAATDRF